MGGMKRMEHIWSPWRMDYIMNHDRAADCVFCSVLRSSDDVANLIVCRGEQAFVILNRYPYTSGHLMVVPFAHVATLDALGPSVRAELIELANHAALVLSAVYQPQGFNFGINMGEAAGAGIANHIHLHIVPRWAGDTNFMSSVAATRVLPEHLEDTCVRIRAQWEKC